MFSLDGRSVAGAGALPPTSPAPPSWASYVNVNDLDATVDRASTAGATIIVSPMTVMDQGRMALISDPEGATLGLWEAGQHRGAELVNRPGTLVWNELNTRDVEGAMRFYEQVFPWTYATDDMGDGATYTSIRIPEGFNADGYNGGLFLMDDSSGDLPASWGVYFLADAVDAVVAKAAELGGTVHKAPFETPAGKMAVLADPQGAVFMLMEG
ncbi:MAG: VOC family protein [Bacteroidota bacterium]